MPTANAADPPLLPVPEVFYFEASAEAVVLTRETTGNFIILEDTVTGNEILGSDDFEFEWVPGADVRLGVGMGQFGISGRFFGGFQWDESQAVVTTPIWNLPTNPPLFGLGVANIDADYDTELHTGELALSFSPFEQVQLLAGARGLFLGESLDINADFGGNAATVSTLADTWGFGPQIGLLVSTNLPGNDRFFIDAEFRGGYLFTESDLDFSVVQAIGPAFGATGNPEGETFFGEGALAARFQFNENMGIRVGYNILFVDDIPTAPSSIGGVDVLAGTVNRTSDQLLVHGARIGFVGRF